MLEDAETRRLFDWGMWPMRNLDYSQYTPVSCLALGLWFAGIAAAGLVELTLRGLMTHTGGYAEFWPTPGPPPYGWRKGTFIQGRDIPEKVFIEAAP